MADGLFPKRKPLTKDDIKRLRESLPKKVEISSEGTRITEHDEEPVDLAPILESHGQIEFLDNGGRTGVRIRIKHRPDDCLIHTSRVKGIDADGHGDRKPDGVAQLYFAAVRQSRGHDVLGHVASHVGSAAIHLRGILAGKRAAAVAGISAVGVHNDFSSGEPGIRRRAAFHEAAGGIDEELRASIHHGDRQSRQNHVGDHIASQLFDIHIGLVLG